MTKPKIWPDHARSLDAEWPPREATTLTELVAEARADSRMILVQLRQGKDAKVLVTIYSDDAAERKSAASVGAAVRAIAAMKSWGYAGTFDIALKV